MRVFLAFASFCLAITLLFACSKGDKSSQFVEQKIIIAGSSTVLPISEAWASSLKKSKEMLVNVQGGGSSNGINLATLGTVDLGASSRDLSPSEKENLDVVPIARDALAIIVNKDNPLNTLSLSQLKDVFSGKITNWQELGGSDTAIQIINRESGSGTRSCLEELVMCKDQQNGECATEMSFHSLVHNSNAEVKKYIKLIPNSIGYISYGYLSDSVKVLAVDNVPISLETIKNKSYPISRELFYVRQKNKKSPLVDKYLKFVLSSKGQAIVLEQGFMPVINPE